VGLVLAVGGFALVSQLPEEQLLSWGWRIPFLASFVILFVALYIRQRLAERKGWL
jgi:MHS family shikimate/dehydroshikimate transporter-like MFS transporter